MNLKISHEQHNNQDLVCAPGEYVFKYLSNQKPVFLRESVCYRFGTGRYDTKYVSYSLSYRDGHWRVRRNENGSDWKDAKIVFRQKTECKNLLCSI